MEVVGRSGPLRGALIGLKAETASANLLYKLLIECAFSIHAGLCPNKGPSSIFGFPRTAADFTSPL